MAEETIKKADLEDFLIDSTSSRYNPSVAVALAKRFNLDFRRIRLGWIEKDQPDLAAALREQDKKRCGHGNE